MVGQKLNASNGYVGVRCVPSATHAPRTHRSQNKVLGIEVFVKLFFKSSLYFFCTAYFSAKFCEYLIFG